MNFELPEDIKNFKQEFKKFCEKEIAPRAEEIDKEEKFSWENWKALTNFGYQKLFFPEEYNGLNAPMLMCVVAAEELTRVCASTALSASASSTLCGYPIKKFGNDQQKKKYITKLADGEIIGGFGLTEPNCGSDAGALKTTAVKKNGKYILNGTKMFITNGTQGEIFSVFAITDKSAGHKGISAFIVEKNYKGFSAGKQLEKMGVRGSPTSELIFDECEVPTENLIGQEGEGFKYAMKTLEIGRIGMSAWCLGIAQAALEEAIKYAEIRTAFNKPIGYFQGVNFKIADMYMMVDTARLLTYNAAWLCDNGLPFTTQASCAKLFASESAEKCTSLAVQIHGGYGYIKEYKVERLFRDARLGTIGEGTSEVQRVVLAKELLKD